MAELDAAELMCAEIKTPMNFNKIAEFGACRNNHLYVNFDEFLSLMDLVHSRRSIGTRSVSVTRSSGTHPVATRSLGTRSTGKIHKDVKRNREDDSVAFRMVPLRYHGSTRSHVHNQGFIRYHDDSSESSNTSRYKIRGRRNRCCLLVFLLLAALIAAIGIGLLVYYLLSQDAKSQKTYGTVASGSLPLLNVPFTEPLLQNSSRDFKNVEQVICQQMTESFKHSRYDRNLENCAVETLRADQSPKPCDCSGIFNLTIQQNTRASVKLTFRGEVNLTTSVANDIINKQLARLTGADYDVVMIKHIIVDIVPRVPPEVASKDTVGVIARLTVHVYNLTYTSQLEDHSSQQFLQLSLPFGYDIDRILKNMTRYHSSHVMAIRGNPDVVITEIWLKGNDVTGVEDVIIRTLNYGARNVTVKDKLRRIIGTLLITPEFGDQTNVTIQVKIVGDNTTIAPTPTVRPPWISGMPYVEAYLKFTGVDYIPLLSNRNSGIFQQHAMLFCNALEEMIMKSSWKDSYYACNLVNIYPPKTDEFYPYLRAIVHVTTGDQSAVDLSNVIRKYAYKHVFPDNVDTYRVGDLYVILDDGRINIYTSAYDTDVITSFRTVATGYPSVFTSFGIISDFTSGQTTTPEVSSIRTIIYNATAAFIRSDLLFFTYTIDLEDKSSERFTVLEQQFCAQIDRYFASSTISSLYKQCNILYFSPGPQMEFMLEFLAPGGDYLKAVVPAIIVQSAPKVQSKDRIALNIGGLNLLYDVFSWTASVTNFTSAKGTPTSTLLSVHTSSSVEMSSTVAILPSPYSATLVNVICRLAGEVAPELYDKRSSKFTSQQLTFCQTLFHIFKPTVPVTYRYLSDSCYVIAFSDTAQSVQFHIMFANEAISNLGDIIVDVINTKAHRDGENLNIGGVNLKPGSCSANIFQVNYTSGKDTVFPTLTPTQPVVLQTQGFYHCMRNPCQHDGTCLETSDFYRCICPDGWSGQDCEEAIDQCDVIGDRCKNGGTCEHFSPNSYKCSCTDSWTGQNCETVINKCEVEPSLCKNGGTCAHSPPDPPKCLCPGEWTGPNCSIELNQCEVVSDRCRNGGTCEHLPPKPLTCICASGWTGPNCSTAINYCENVGDLCKNGGTCESLRPNTYKCICTSDWTGHTCETVINKCEAEPALCKNGGTCVHSPPDIPKCLCPSGWTGPNCSIVINKCEVEPGLCKNGGTCAHSPPDPPKCLCPGEWTGPNCDTELNHCEVTSDLCKNGGTCTHSPPKPPTCLCMSSWTGPNCSTAINQCGVVGDVCKNGGTCEHVSSDHFKCLCTAGWTGQNCEIEVNQCQVIGDLCKNGGTCEHLPSKLPTCLCASGWTGPNCTAAINHCDVVSELCKNGGTCEHLAPNPQKCICANGWTGLSCETEVNHCEVFGDQCKNGGTCQQLSQKPPTCLCASGWTGPNCTVAINQCEVVSDQCKNGGTCEHLPPNHQKCYCTNGWTGPTCETVIDQCQIVSDLCKNGGTCEHFPPKPPTCLCASGWTGPNCTAAINHCEVVGDFCKNGGTCEHVPPNPQKCLCMNGWTGPTCETEINQCDVSSDMCKNGGTCKHIPPKPATCLCASGWTGPNCSTEVNQCEVVGDLCKNGGTCEQLPQKSPTCLCASGWTGPNCTTELNHCEVAGDLCKNGGTCQQLPQKPPTCLCVSGWTGSNCTTALSLCEVSDYCKNGGICEHLAPNPQKCYCTTGWTGPTCETELNECEVVGDLCKNGGTCEQLPQKPPTCLCASGWTGPNCTTVQTGNVSMSFETVGLTITPGMMNPLSEQFKSQQTAFCQDITGLLSGFDMFRLQSCSIQFGVMPPNVTVHLEFGGDMKMDNTSTVIRELIFEVKNRTRIGDVYAVRIGDLAVKHSDVVTTVVTMTKPLLNFTYDTNLTVSSSTTYIKYEESFCAEINRLMAVNKITFPSYNTCNISDFSTNPNAVTFALKFEGDHNATIIEQAIDAMLKTEYPRITFEGMLGIRVADFLFLISGQQGNFSASLSYKLIDVTWDQTLNDTKSSLFQLHALPFCSKIDELMKRYATVTGYVNCSVQQFVEEAEQPSVSVVFALDFIVAIDLAKVQSEVSNIVFSNTPLERLGNLIGNRVSDLVYFASILRYFEIPYDGWISNISMHLHSEKNLSSDFLNSSSDVFMSRQERLCSKTDGFATVLLNSTIFGPRYLKCFVHGYTYNAINMTVYVIVSLLFNYREPILRNEVYQLLTSHFPKEIADDGLTYQIGDSLVILKADDIDNIKVNISDYVQETTATTKIPDFTQTRNISLNFETVGLTITPALMNRLSEEFKNQETAFCQDITRLFSGYDMFREFHSCSIHFGVMPPNVTVHLEFGGDMKMDNISTVIRELIFEVKNRTRIGDVYAVRIGDLAVKHSDVVTTVVTMTKPLLNFTYDTNLTVSSSTTYIKYEESFCAEINRLMAVNKITFPSYNTCNISDFSTNPNAVTFALKFEGDHNATIIEQAIDAMLKTEYPRITFEGMLGIRVADFLFLISGQQRNFSASLSYKLIDVTWDQTLNDTKSSLFQLHALPFCSKIDELMKRYATVTGYVDCSVQQFVEEAGQPSVSVVLALDFIVAIDLAKVQSEVSNIVFSNTPLERLGNLIGNRVSDLVYFASILRYFEIPYDGWISNISMHLHSEKNLSSDFLNSSSDVFMSRQERLCSKTDGFAAVLLNSTIFGPRYLKCFVHGYTYNAINMTVYVIVSLLFNYREPILRNEVYQLLTSHFPKEIADDGLTYQIGDSLVILKADDIDNIKVNISDYVQETTATTKIPDFTQTRNISLNFETVGLTITPALMNRLSEEFKNQETAFCQDITRLFSGYDMFREFHSCSIHFGDMPPNVTVQLAFGVDMKLENPSAIIRELIFEVKERKRIGNVYAVRIGDLAVKHSDVITTNIIMTKRLLNFTYDATLQVSSSSRYMQYEESFCAEINRFMALNKEIFPFYYKCNITEFSTDPNAVKFTLLFEGVHNVTILEQEIDAKLNTEYPRIVFEGMRGIQIADFWFLISEQQGNLSASLSYKLIDVTWDQALKNTSSSLFQLHALSFCTNISELTKRFSTFTGYRNCSVQQYLEESGQPSVTVVFTLDFNVAIEIEKVQSEVSNIIFSNTPLERVGDLVGNRVSDLVYFASIVGYFEIPYDGWISNISLQLYSENELVSDLLNFSSDAFKSRQERLCSQSDGFESVLLNSTIFRPRYLKCFIHGFMSNAINRTIHVIVSLLFNYREPILRNELQHLITNGFPVKNVSGVLTYQIGDSLAIINAEDIDNIKVNISDYVLETTTTTKLPDLVINQCEIVPEMCKNGGTCSHLPPSPPRCSCSTGWTGPICTTVINQCEVVLDLCKNGGTCSHSPPDPPTCLCTPNWTGPNCTTDKTDLNQCEAVPDMCKNGGTCNHLPPNPPTCSCAVDWTGPNCTTVINQCAVVLDLCKNGGTCSHSPPNTPKCSCSTGWTGPNCTTSNTDISQCDAVPDMCKNGGTCKHLPPNPPTCSCAVDWTGPNCTIVINQCEVVSDLCKNGGTCSHSPPNPPTCLCTPNWTGPHCTSDKTAQTSKVSLQFQTVGLTITSALMNPVSEQFKNQQTAFCQDVTGLLSGYDLFRDIVSCSIQFGEMPPNVTVQLEFGSMKSGNTSTIIKELIFEVKDRKRIDNVYAVRIGDLAVKHSDVITTNVTITKRLLNFTYDASLRVPSSSRYMQYEESFCSEINRLMAVNVATFPFYYTCYITEFSTDPNAVKFTLEFEGYRNAATIEQELNAKLNKEYPRITFEGMKGIQVADFWFLVSEEQGNVSASLSYKLIDVTWDEALKDTTSSLFKKHALPFCLKIDELMKKYATVTGYISCSVQQYVEESGKPSVSVTFSLDFNAAIDVAKVQSEVSNIVLSNTPLERVNDLVGNRVSDLVYFASVVRYFEIPYDGWISNITFKLYFENNLNADLLDSSSDAFKSKQERFCSKTDGFDSAVSNSTIFGPRYLKCFVHGYTFDAMKRQVNAIISLLFNYREPILRNELKDLITSRFPFINVGGDMTYQIGDNLVIMTGENFEEIKVNISDYLQQVAATTKLPDYTEMLVLRLPLFNLTQDFQDNSSFAYKNGTEWLSKMLDSYFFSTSGREIPMYGGSRNTSVKFKTEENRILLEIDLVFHEPITNKLKTVTILQNVIKELARHYTLPDGQVSLVIGPFVIPIDLFKPEITNPELI